MTTLSEKIKSLPKSRRDKINSRARELIEKLMAHDPAGDGTRLSVGG